MGFNPCFCGTRARTGSGPRIRTPGPVSILVFVELAPGPDGNWGKFIDGSRFNPCFCGTRARTTTTLVDLQRLTLFQSLFLWNSRPDNTKAISKEEFKAFQSLFLWNSRPDAAPQAASAAPLAGFNPCFCGTRARTSVPDTSSVTTVGFQSLFLWNSRPDLCTPFQPGMYPCFNPCFCGTRARTLATSEPANTGLSFNPCFCGTRARTAADFRPFPCFWVSNRPFQTLPPA